MSALGEINAATWAIVNSHLGDAAAYGSDIARIAVGQAINPDQDTRPRFDVR
jgi:hypothetical protein